MAQASRTTCAHNASGQTVLAGRPTPCRKCGAMIEATPRAVQANALIPSEKMINATYPGDGNTADAAWAFNQ